MRLYKPRLRRAIFTYRRVVTKHTLSRTGHYSARPVLLAPLPCAAQWYGFDASLNGDPSHSHQTSPRVSSAQRIMPASSSLDGPVHLSEGRAP